MMKNGNFDTGGELSAFTRLSKAFSLTNDLLDEVYDLLEDDYVYGDHPTFDKIHSYLVGDDGVTTLENTQGNIYEEIPELFAEINRLREQLALIHSDTFYEDSESISVKHVIRKRAEKALGVDK